MSYQDPHGHAQLDALELLDAENVGATLTLSMGAENKFPPPLRETGTMLPLRCPETIISPKVPRLSPTQCH